MSASFSPCQGKEGMIEFVCLFENREKDYALLDSSPPAGGSEWQEWNENQDTPKIL